MFEYLQRLRSALSVDQAILQIASGPPHLLLWLTHGGICDFVALMRQKRWSGWPEVMLGTARPHPRDRLLANGRMSCTAGFHRLNMAGQVCGDAGVETTSSGSRMIVASRVDLVFAR